jgi:hypothetical protein
MMVNVLALRGDSREPRRSHVLNVLVVNDGLVVGLSTACTLETITATTL